jgi:hypothetical protein
VIWADEVPDEHHGVCDKEAAGHQRWGGNHTKYLLEELCKQKAFFRAKSPKKGKVLLKYT